MKVIPVPCLTDNLSYLITGDYSPEAIVVDPSQAGPVIEAARQNGVIVTHVFTTHHHQDHIGGLEALLLEYPRAQVYGHSFDRFRTPKLSCFLEDKQIIRFGNSSIVVYHQPCHTSGHVSYVFAQEKTIFSGDTLFAAGCGRLFEDNAPSMMYHLARLLELPEDSRVFPGHDYAIKNLEFATQLDPDNTDIKDRLAGARDYQEKKRPFLPFTLAEEKKTNPFLRLDSAAMKEKVKQKYPDMEDTPESLFTHLRLWRDEI